MNFYQQPYAVPFSQGMYQQPVYPQFVYADQLVGQQANANPLSNEQSYVENILRMNYGKVVTVYMNYENSQWGSKVFKGVLLGAGTDHIILKDVASETRYLLLTIYLCYITFDEKIEYEYPYRNKSSQQ